MKNTTGIPRKAIANTPGQTGALIRRIRKQRGMTQKDLARITACSVKFIGEVENGKETAEIGKALRLVSRLDCNIYVEWKETEEE